MLKSNNRSRGTVSASVDPHCKSVIELRDDTVRKITSSAERSSNRSESNLQNERALASQFRENSYFRQTNHQIKGQKYGCIKILESVTFSVDFCFP